MFLLKLFVLPSCAAVCKCACKVNLPFTEQQYRDRLSTIARALMNEAALPCFINFRKRGKYLQNVDPLNHEY